MYIFDRDLVDEHLRGPATSPDFGRWPIRELAAQGQTFVDVPKGFDSRIAVPLDVKALLLEESCFVHHLPNSYADNANSRFGKIPVDQVVARRSLGRLYARMRWPV